MYAQPFNNGIMASLDMPNFYTSYLNYGFVNMFSRGIS